METIGDRIKQIRNDHNMTQEQFGKKIGIKKAAVSKIEKNDRCLTEAVSNNIIREFCVNREWLLNGTGPKYDEGKRLWREFSEVELVFHNEEMLAKQNELFSLINKSPEEERAMLFTALGYIYSILLSKKLGVNSYYEYYQQFAIIFMELCNFIEELNSEQVNDSIIIANCLGRIEKYLRKIFKLYNPEFEFGADVNKNAISELSDGEFEIIKLFRLLDEAAQKELIDFARFKQSQSSGSKRKKPSSNFGHGEEAATMDMYDKKMA